MKTIKFFLLTIFLIFSEACTEKPAGIGNPPFVYEPPDTTYSIDTRGYWENGEIVKTFDCPDSRFFPPIDIKNWDKTPVVNGRLPTYKETLNGMSIHTYG